MPIYEYACANCDHALDALQKIADEPLVDCPECGEPALKRLLSAPSFRLKGQGWYETDFKKDNQRNLHGDKDDKPKKESKGRMRTWFFIFGAILVVFAFWSLGQRKSKNDNESDSEDGDKKAEKKATKDDEDSASEEEE